MLDRPAESNGFLKWLYMTLSIWFLLLFTSGTIQFQMKSDEVQHVEVHLIKEGIKYIVLQLS